MAEEPPRGSYVVKYVCMYVCMYKGIHNNVFWPGLGTFLPLFFEVLITQGQSEAPENDLPESDTTDMYQLLIDSSTRFLQNNRRIVPPMIRGHDFLTFCDSNYYKNK